MNPIIVALDVSDVEKAITLSKILANAVGAIKIGSELFTTAGPEIVRTIRGAGAQVFLDLKYHDIPNTVAKAVSAAVKLDVQMITVHTSGGRIMLQEAEKAAQETARSLNRPPPLVLGVTVLTSLDNQELEELGISANAEDHVERLAKLAVASGLRGLVCSPLEIRRLRSVLPTDIKLVTPGIRAETDVVHDQKRTLTPSEAIKAGADWLVIGRPIYGANDPFHAAQAILASLNRDKIC